MYGTWSVPHNFCQFGTKHIGWLMVYPTDKDTEHIKDKSMGTEGYLKYTKEKEKSEPTWCGVWKTNLMWGLKKTNTTAVVVVIQGQVKTNKYFSDIQALCLLWQWYYSYVGSSFVYDRFQFPDKNETIQLVFVAHRIVLSIRWLFFIAYFLGEAFCSFEWCAGTLSVLPFFEFG